MKFIVAFFLVAVIFSEVFSEDASSPSASKPGGPSLKRQNFPRGPASKPANKKVPKLQGPDATQRAQAPSLNSKIAPASSKDSPTAPRKIRG